MGYTHYWQMKPANQTAFNKAVAKANKVLKARKGILAGGDGTGSLVIKKDEVCFNGRDEDAHETCYITNGGADFTLDGSGFTFCKTACKPYDVVVVAVLAIFSHELGSAFEVSSDGEHDDWNDGVKLACQVTGEAIPNPLIPAASDQELVFLVRARGRDAFDARTVVDEALEAWASKANVDTYGTESYEG
jgi:hypothetical protein